MMSQSSERTELPDELRSPRAKLVYLFLSTRGSATITELQAGLEMKKIALYSILKTLRERDLVVREADRYVIR